MRPELSHPPCHEGAVAKMSAFHADVVHEVREAVAKHAVVVVGMGWNPNVGRARKALEAAGVEYHYLGYGNYVTAWKQRLAIKLWSGWPTYPQVFVNGVLIGGADQTQALLAAGGVGSVAAV